MFQSFRRHMPAVGLLTLILLVLFIRSFDPSLTLSVGDASLSTIHNMYLMLPALFSGPWVPTAGLGNPGSPLNVAPGHGFVFLAPFTKYVDVNAVFHLLLMGIGGYFLLWDMTRNRFAAFTGGLFLMLQPHVLSHLLPGHVGHFIMAGWIPLVFLFTRRAILTGGLLNWSMAGACMGALLAAGTHDVAAFAGITLAAYGLFLLIRSRANRTSVSHWITTIGGILLAGALVLLMSYQALFSNLLQQMKADKSATTLETAGGQSMSPREKWFWATQWSVPPAEIADMVIPGFFGWGSSTADNPYRGRIGQTEGWMTHRQGMPNLNDVCQYLGAVLLLGLLLSLALRRRDPEMWFFLAAAGVSLLLAFGKFGPLYRLFYEIPGMDALRNPIKWFYITSLGAGVVGALGLAEAARTDAPSLSRIKSALLAFAPALVVLTLGTFLLNRLENDPFPFWQEKSLVNRSWESIRLAALFWGTGGLAVFLMLVSRGSGRHWGPRAGMTLASLVMVGELFYVNSHYMPYHSWQEETNAGSFTPFLKSVNMPCRFRFLRQDGAFHYLKEIAIMEGMEYADPYPARLPDEYLLLQRRLEQADPLKFWRLCNVRYVVAPSVLKSPAFQPVLSLQAGNTPIVVHELKTALDRCVRVASWRAVPKKDAAELMAAPDFDPGREVLVHAEASELPPLPDATPSKTACRITSYSLTSVIAETESDQPGMVVFLTRHDPSWTARVDGTPVPIWKANGIMQACSVPAGKHTLEWQYAPPNGKRHLHIAMAGWGLAALLLVAGLVVQFKHTPKVLP